MLYVEFFQPLSVSRMEETAGGGALLPFSNEYAMVTEKYDII